MYKVWAGYWKSSTSSYPVSNTMRIFFSASPEGMEDVWLEHRYFSRGTRNLPQKSTNSTERTRCVKYTPPHCGLEQHRALSRNAIRSGGKSDFKYCKLHGVYTRTNLDLGFSNLSSRKLE